MTIKEQVLGRLFNQPDPTDAKTQLEVYQHFRLLLSYKQFRGYLCEYGILIPTSLNNLKYRVDNPGCKIVLNAKRRAA